MTPLTLIPTAPPSRPVAPAGGGAADTSSSASFESALQRADAPDDSQRADTKPVSRPAADKPPARRTPARSQDDKRTRDGDGSIDDEAPAATPTRTRDASRRDALSGKRKLADTPNPPSDDTEVAPVVVSIQGPVPVAATQPGDLAATAAVVTAGRLSALPEAKANALQPADAVPVVPHIKDKVAEGANATTGLVDDAVEARDLAEVKPKPASQPAGPSVDVSRAQAPRTVAQAARALLADALQRAGAPSAQQTLPTHDARSALEQPPDAALTPAAALKPSQAPVVASGEPTLQLKPAAKAYAQAPSVQDVMVQATGSSQHESHDAGNGGTSTGSGRHESAPMPQPKADAPVAWPTAFAVRVPEAMTSSLERTGTTAPALPSPGAQSDLESVGPQLVRRLHLQAHAGGGDMKMTLTPEHLGEVTIEVQVRHDRVTATLTAETSEVRQWISTHQADLKSSLASVGLSLEELVVKDDGGGGRQDAPGDKPQSQPRRRQPASEHDQAQFEVLV